MTNVGIIGFGQMGLSHAAIVNSLPNCKVNAICDKESFLLNIGKKVLPNINFYSNYIKMIDQEGLDAVFITTPPSFHVPIILDIVRHSKTINLFVEKPLAASYEQALLAVNAVKNSERKVTVGFQKRFASTFVKAKEILDSKALGDLVFFRGYFYTSDILKEGKGAKFERETGGVVLEFSPHLVDLVIWLFGEPKTINSSTSSFFSTRAEDYFHAMLGYENGLVGNIDVCWSMRNFKPSELMIEIHGKNGFLNVTDDRLTIDIDQHLNGQFDQGTHVFYSANLFPRIPFLFSHPEFVLEDLHFLRCIESNQWPEQNFDTAARVNRFLDIIRKIA